MSKEFKRQDWHKKKKLGTSWRKPKGYQSKIRKSMGGKPKLVRIGRKKKSTHQTFRINSLKDFENNLSDIKKKGLLLSISARLGLRSKIKILEEVVASKLKVENMRKPDLVLSRLKKKVEDKKSKKKQILKRKENKKQQTKENKKEDKKKENTPKKETKEVEKTIDEKQQEKKEKDKRLISTN